MNGAEHLLGPAALEQHGERTAFICDDRQTTFAELALQVARASEGFRSLQLRPGDRVLFLMRDTPEFAAAWLGALRAGVVAIALNTRLSEPEYRHILTDSGARLVVVDASVVAARPDLAAELALDEKLVVSGDNPPASARSWRAIVAGAPPVSAAFAAQPSQPAFWLYSSGTTGRPKGIVHTHKDLLPVGQAFRELGLSGGDRVFASSKLFFAYGLEHGFLGTLAIGATSLLCADWADPASALDIIARHRPDVFMSVPSFYRRLLSEPARNLEQCRPVRFFVSAGERLPAQLVAQWKNAVGAEILSLYGTSETFCVSMITPPGTSTGVRTGLPVSGVEARLVDAKGGEPAPGESGVLWLRHPALSNGYANLPEPTQEQFVDGWFCTRDLFSRDEAGFYLHEGRSDESLKVAGQWVQPADIEEAVAAVDSVAEAACVIVSDSDGFERLALFINTHGDPALALEAASLACERQLPRHKRPKWVRAVGELPRTATGKVQRFKLREMLLQELAADG